MVGVEGVGGVEDFDVHVPFFEVGGRHEGYAVWEVLVYLLGLVM